ncbi:hypothetical protein FA95DRAFT_1608438 [Auriscalpium vulgare]|uniref:Uncharacterized protein n=1 Tax=Auriscalpium vulgare TaxID=40419 RepID=A0ACB8RKH0_9AGAM|nr:hypothetical protein FA95DRAFT_1608438 [Auriscalpium vulgare]
MAALSFQRFLRDRYPSLKAQHADVGQRRKTRLRVIDEFWKLDPLARAAPPPSIESSETSAACDTDEDTYDDISSPDSPNLGIIVRTDYANEDAWKTFYLTLLEAEKELIVDSEPPANASEPGTSAPAAPTASSEDVDMADIPSGDGEDEDEDDADEPLAFFAVLEDEPALLTGLSNIGALRLVNDVSVRAAPALPEGQKRRASPGHRLVDMDGLQECYFGKTVWVYDAQSNTDGCVRLVNQHADLYGTATGDSWRARASHITELQVNLTSGAMKIDFGGLDRYDYAERRRNLAMVELPL